MSFKTKNIHPLFVTTTAGKVIKNQKKEKVLLFHYMTLRDFQTDLRFLRTGSDVKNYIEF